MLSHLCRLTHILCIGIAVTFASACSAIAYVEPPDNGDITISILPPESDASKAIYEEVKHATQLQDLVQALNDIFLLPRPMEFKFADCDSSDTESSTTLPVTICYSLIKHTALLDSDASSKNNQSSIINALIFSFLNRLAPVLASQFELRLDGSQHYSMPELATVLALLVGDGISSETLEGISSVAIDITNAENAQETPPYWILRGFTPETASSSACMVYGSDPVRFNNMIDLETLSKEEGDRCNLVFSQKMEQWSILLEPHLKQ